VSIDLDEIRNARLFLAAHFQPTRLVPAIVGGVAVHLKLECELPTGSFKVRGALYSLARQQQRGPVSEVVAASTGNHGAAVAYAARMLGVRATIFLPRQANLVKATRIVELGATLVECGDDLSAAIDGASEHARRAGAFFLHDASDPLIPAGTGTIGLEIAEQLPDVGAVFVPVGDTALIRGVASALKACRPDVLIVGAVAAGAPAYFLSWQRGTVVETSAADTVAEGLAVRRPLPGNVGMIRALVDDIRVVDDDEMLQTAALLWRAEQIRAEPSGVAGLAALLQSPPPRGPIAVLVTGSNIAQDVEQQVLERAERQA
jgi:threonine dehydratase